MEIDVCPRWLLCRLGVPAAAQRHVALLLSGLVALTFAPVLIHLPHFCLMRRFFGVPCPGCGILHSITELLQLHVTRAWHCNPAGIAVAGMFTLQLVARPFAIVSARTRPFIDSMSRWGSSCALGCLIAVWVWRITN